MHTKNGFFVDDFGRKLILRGINLGGSSKVPYTPNGATYQREHFFDYKGVSFVGRPFPLSEANEHFARLKAWGMRFLRFIITWEAIEHDAPGVYDEAYLDYLVAILKKADEYGITCFIDPHQDVWSRWTGGDGAPAWTLELVGFDIRKLHQVGATISHPTHGDPFPQMIWPSNYTKLATATMFTLFFGGDEFAPKTQINGVSAQEFLQSHFINSIAQVALRVKDLPNVVGFDSLNEPSGGYIGQPLDNLGERMVTVGISPTAYQGMLAGAGYGVDVDVWAMSLVGKSIIGKHSLNSDHVRVWRDGYECIWKQNGVWTDENGTPELLRPHHFQRADGTPIDIATDYMKPFMTRYIHTLRQIMPNAMLFVEGIPGGAHPHWGENDPQNSANASHWYDVMTLYHKRFFREKTLDWGKKAIVEGAEHVQSTFNSQLKAQKDFALQHMNGMPTIIGEFGLPFDLDQKRAYSDGDFSEHEDALSMYYDAMDANLLSCTLWNYTADNTNARGDGWNDEDISVYSRDQETDASIHSGGRALKGFVRPYPMATSGEPLHMAFDRHSKTFTFRYRNDPTITVPTILFLPSFVYEHNFALSITPEGTLARQTVQFGDYNTNLESADYRVIYDKTQEILMIYTGIEGEIEIIITTT
jgi:hypothetical protein